MKDNSLKRNAGRNLTSKNLLGKNLLGENLSEKNVSEKKLWKKSLSDGKLAAVILISLSILLSFLPAMKAQAQEQARITDSEEINEGINREINEEMNEEINTGINEEIKELNQIMTAVEDLEAKAAPDESAGTVISYRGGDNVFVTGETPEGWYRVRYQDLTGYIRAGAVSEMELDVEALNQEFAIEESEGKLVVEEVERRRDEARRSRIWGTVIILLVAGIFATGIVSAVKSGKREEAES